MELRLSERLRRPDFQEESLTMILEVAAAGNVISFAGGLPNPLSFPIKELEVAVQNVLEKHGTKALQYSTPEGNLSLRQAIADRYAKQGVKVSADEILITSGSQQGLEMLAAALIDDGDSVAVENPTYLAALQAFHLFNPKIHTVEMTSDGASPEELSQILAEHDPKFFYTVPDFHNPTGLTYSNAVRRAIADIMKCSYTFLVEDNPYVELRFNPEEPPKVSFKNLLGEQCLLTGSFSKIISPGVRVGWIVCSNKEMWKKLVSYKQRIDMHTSTFIQMVLDEYLRNNDLDAHIAKIRDLYSHQAGTMLNALQKYFPAEASWTHPQGGMFIWATLPKGLTAIELYREAAKEGVAFVYGDAFYEKDRNVPTMRLNYTNSTDEVIEKGISILGKIIHRMMKEKGIN